MNDWTSTFANMENIPDERRKFAIRLSAGFRTWLDATGLELAMVGMGEIERFRVEVPIGPGTWAQRKWAIRRLVDAAVASTPRRSRPAGTASARVDLVVPRCFLGRAIAAVLADATNARRRRTWPTLLGRFLLYCDECDRDPTECWEADLVPYQRWLVRRGNRSTGELVHVARRLLRAVERTRLERASGGPTS
jgi:hypothetical protein